MIRFFHLASTGMLVALCSLDTGCENVPDSGRTGEVATGKAIEMAGNQDKTANLLKLPDEEYFTFDEEKELKLQEQLADLARSEREDDESPPDPLMVLSAPDRMDLETQQLLPVLLGVIQTGLRSWQVTPETNLYVFIRDIQRGTLHEATPLWHPDMGNQFPLSRAGAPPDPFNANCWYTSVEKVDLRTKLVKGSFSPGKHSAIAIAFDLCSNQVAIEMTGKEEPGEAPGTEPQSYLKSVNSPADISETTLKLDQPEGAEPTLEISTRIRNIEHLPKTESGQAVWTCNILLFKLDERVKIIPATVPVTELSKEGDLSAVIASFRVDLESATKSNLQGEYKAYLDVGTAFHGPYALTVD